MNTTPEIELFEVKKVPDTFPNNTVPFYIGVFELDLSMIVPPTDLRSKVKF
jgi:hypothetical protein